MKWEVIRKDFPLIHKNYRKLIYFDNAATTQKPKRLIDSLQNYYTKYNSNIHRGNYFISQESERLYEKTRDYIAEIYSCKKEEVVFTKNDTEGMNIVANGLLGKFGILKGKKINLILPKSEHHANLVPWFAHSNGTVLEEGVLKNYSKKVRYCKFDSNGLIDIEHLESLLDSSGWNIFALNWISNSFGSVNDIKKIIARIRSLVKNVIIVVDGAQYVPYYTFNFQRLDADFISFSAHKLCGPTGLGILIGRLEYLESMPPLLYGGDMIQDVSETETLLSKLPNKFEAGTPNIASVIAFKESLEYLHDTVTFKEVQNRCKELGEYLIYKLHQLDFVKIYGLQKYTKNRVGIVSFNIDGVHPHDAGSVYSDTFNICLRTGAHCNHLIMKELKISSTIRASLYFYNTFEEIDIFIDATKQIHRLFK